MELVREDTRWRLIATELRSDVADEVYPPGTPLPGEAQLAEKYGASRPTVRRAIATLVGEGLLTVSHGRGTFVRPRPDRRVILIGDDPTDAGKHPDLLDGRYDPLPQGWLRGEHPEAAKIPRGEARDAVVTPASRDEAEALNIKTGELIIRRFQLWHHRTTHRPIEVVSITPARLFNFPFGPSSWDEHGEQTDEEITSRPLVRAPLADEPDDVFDKSAGDDEPSDAAPIDFYADLAEERGPVRFLATVTSRMPHSDELDDLQMETGTPALEIRRTMIDPDGRPLEVTTITAAADRFEAASAQGWPDETAPVALRL